MARIGFSERVWLAAQQASRLGRLASARAFQTTREHWLTGEGASRALVIVPPELRAADPSFWPEVLSGHFGLAGAVAELNGRSPFEIAPPTVSWERELHGFAWLRHLEAADDPAAEAAARGLLAEWVQRGQSRNPVAAEPAVRARRIMSWVAHAPLLLDGATASAFDRFTAALWRDVELAKKRGQTAADGHDRLLLVTARAIALVAMEGEQSALQFALTKLDVEIARQILADGGHISRNPALLAELMFDWLPLRSCLDARRVETSSAFVDTLQGMLGMLRVLRLGDGSLARFNGMSVGDPSSLATLLAYADEAPHPAYLLCPQSRYARLSCGQTIVIADVGSPPPLAASTAAHAGCLAIEVSVGGLLLVCNGGAPGPADPGWVSVARATASHSTVCVGEMASSKLVRNAKLEAQFGTAPLQGPDHVSASCRMEGWDAVLDASHDGYLDRLGLIHHRHVSLSGDGGVLQGRDRLETKDGLDRLKHDVPFAAHFHLHPDSVCEPLALQPPGGGFAFLIQLRDGQRWVFAASGQSVGGLPATGISVRLEESLFFAATFGPRPALQLVVRGASGGITEIAWSLKRLDVIDQNSAPHDAGGAGS